MVQKDELEDYVPDSCQYLLEYENEDLRSAIPELARDWEKMMEIESVIETLPSEHRFHQTDARDLDNSSNKPNSTESEMLIENNSTHLILTSPPYFNIKEYNGRRNEGQLGDIEDYDSFCEEISAVWEECYDKLIPGGRMCVVTGDILQSRRENGRHRALPLHSTIQEQCRRIGFDCLAPIIWSKIGNATLEAGGNARFLGKPYEPGAVVKNDIEYILMFRKPGDYRSPSSAERILSTIQVDFHRKYFQQIWTDIKGENSDKHPAPYPKRLAERLIRMFSFVGDTVLDPFAGVGNTALAASHLGRDSISIEIDPEYISIAKERIDEHSGQNLQTARLSEF
jgi:DNA modification methylase